MAELDKIMVAFRLSKAARDHLAGLAEHHGIDRTAVIEQLLRREARRELREKSVTSASKKPAKPGRS